MPKSNANTLSKQGKKTVLKIRTDGISTYRCVYDLITQLNRFGLGA